ncbi:MAG TPA: hypothetical protein PK951_14695 [Chitinophagaceae bacterium]|nr:hypothetical protein [Chitinophagaceae bacterium]
MKEKKSQSSKNQITGISNQKKKPVIVNHLSSFGVLNRNGLEISTGIENEVADKEEDTRSGEFVKWSMPEQRPGFMQVKKHDFF